MVDFPIAMLDYRRVTLRKKLPVFQLADVISSPYITVLKGVGLVENRSTKCIQMLVRFALRIFQQNKNPVKQRRFAHAPKNTHELLPARRVLKFPQLINRNGLAIPFFWWVTIAFLIGVIEHQ